VDPRRLNLGEWVGGSGALLLIVALFLPWYSAGGSDVTAWQSMTVDDLLLALAALLALGAIVIDSMSRFAASSIAALSFATIAAIVALVLTLYRLADPAPDVGVSLAVGAWLGLIGVACMLFGLLRGMRDEGPARRGGAAERAAAAAGRERAERLPLPDGSDSGPVAGGAG
jgi:4-amino-4-deoxy-L-arabinose transferase-like glycosyltransferase